MGLILGWRRQIKATIISKGTYKVYNILLQYCLLCVLSLKMTTTMCFVAMVRMFNGIAASFGMLSVNLWSEGVSSRTIGKARKMTALVTKTIILLLTNTIKTDANNYPLGRRSALFGCCVDGYSGVARNFSQGVRNSNCLQSSTDALHCFCR